MLDCIGASIVLAGCGDARLAAGADSSVPASGPNCLYRKERCANDYALGRLPTPIAGEAPAPIGMACLLSHYGQKLPAGLLAAPAGLGAHPAMLVLMGMALALVATAVADGHAGL